MNELDEADKLAAYDAESIRLINDATEEVNIAHSEWAADKAKASQSKKEYESAQGQLMKLIETRDKQRGKEPQANLFSPQFVQPPVSEPANEGTQSAPAEQDESWRLVPLTEWVQHGAKEKDIQLLAEHSPPIITVGDLSKFITPNPANPSYAQSLTDVKGIGEVAADRMANAETLFWAAWNARPQPTEATEIHERSDEGAGDGDQRVEAEGQPAEAVHDGDGASEGGAERGELQPPAGGDGEGAGDAAGDA